MPGDELVSGPEREPLRVPPRLRAGLGAALLVAAAAAVVLHGTGGDPGGPAEPAPSTAGTTSPVPAPAPRARLAVGEVCPVRTDARTTLSVSFTVVNRSDAPATLISAEPLLPLAGLLPAGAALAGGSCAAPTPEAPGALRLGGPPLLVTLGFSLPPECPAAYPVQARVFVREDHIESTDLTVLVDLGGTAFDTCPGPG